MSWAGLQKKGKVGNLQDDFPWWIFEQARVLCCSRAGLQEWETAKRLLLLS